MKRWWHWAIGVAVLAALAFAILALVPPSAPYAFLRAKPEVRMNMSPADVTTMNRMGLEFAIYSFPGQFETVRAEADKELKRLGYTDFGAFGGLNKNTKQAMYMTSNFMAGMTSSIGARGSTTPPPMPEMAMVMIMGDTRVTSSTPMGSGSKSPEGNAPGWVTVMAYGTRPKNFFTRFRDWIGL